MYLRNIFRLNIKPEAIAGPINHNVGGWMGCQEQ